MLVRLREAGVYGRFMTRLTGRVGVVLAYTMDRGVLVRWEGGKAPDKYVHEDLIVDEMPARF